MSQADHIASFPTTVWTGSSSIRTDPTTEVPPYVQDWDKIVAEVIAIETYLTNRSGSKVTFTADAAIAVGNIVYVKSNGHVALAVDSSLTLAIGAGFCVDAAISSSGTGLIQVSGIITLPTATWDAINGSSGGLTPGATYYVGATAGTITTTATSTTGHVANIIGVAISATQLVMGGTSPILITHA